MEYFVSIYHDTISNCTQFSILILPEYYIVGEPEPANIIYSPNNYSAILVNETFTTSCHGYGNELPNITWYKHSVQITDNDRITINQRYVPWNSTYQFTESALTVSNIVLEDTGSYSCIARNSNGTDVHHFILIILIPGELVLN